jgi:hypothetical protein
VVSQDTAAFPDARHDITNVNQHVPAPDEIDAAGADRELLDIALHELDLWAAILIQERTPQRRQDYVDPDGTAIEPFSEFDTVVAPAASDVRDYGIPAEPRLIGDIEEESPGTRRETSVQERELVTMGSP